MPKLHWPHWYDWNMAKPEKERATACWGRGGYFAKDIAGVTCKSCLLQLDKKPSRSVLFLDADGVLNCRTTMQRHRGCIGIDPYMAFLVGKILMDSGADMVISSSWRHSEDGIAEIERQVAKSVGITPSIHATGEYVYSRAELCERGQEIKAWLTEHPEYERYAILDDENDMLPEQQENFFKTSWTTGLTPEVAERVTAHLKGFLCN